MQVLEFYIQYSTYWKECVEADMMQTVHGYPDAMESFGSSVPSH